ncbi:MAG: MarR family transcriptional regulator [Pseudorhodoplanes sp.]|nr:MarR family transcriptional regulator [Pseudorhodoplanes sp.]
MPSPRAPASKRSAPRKMQKEPKPARIAGKLAAAGAKSARLGRLSDQVGYLLRRASNVFSAHWALQFRDEGVTITPLQCGMLILIDENPGLTQIELARLLNVEGSTLWQLVDRLLKLGFIRRRRVPDDRRAFAIHLSSGGRRTLQHFEEGLRLHQRALLACLSDKEQGALSAMLLRVIEAGDRLNVAETPLRVSSGKENA